MDKLCYTEYEVYLERGMLTYALKGGDAMTISRKGIRAGML